MVKVHNFLILQFECLCGLSSLDNLAILALAVNNTVARRLCLKGRYLTGISMLMSAPSRTADTAAEKASSTRLEQPSLKRTNPSTTK